MQTKILKFKTWPAPRWLDTSVGRALHRYRRGHTFESRSCLNFCQVLIHSCFTFNLYITAMINYIVIGVFKIKKNGFHENTFLSTYSDISNGTDIPNQRYIIICHISSMRSSRKSHSTPACSSTTHFEYQFTTAVGPLQLHESIRGGQTCVRSCIDLA